jgi:hypothetical protein
MDFDTIKKRFGEAEKRKTNWDTLYRETLKYVAPERENFNQKADGASNKRDPFTIFDSTAITALNKFVSNLQSSLVPPMKKWTRLIPGEIIPPEALDNTKVILDKVSAVMFSAIHNSNFDTQIAEAFTDLAVGTGALLCVRGEDASTPLRFVTVPLNELYLEEGPYGKIDTVFRKHQIEIRNIEGTWEDAKIPDSLQKLIESEPSRREYFIECTYPAKIMVNQIEKDPKTEKTTIRQVEVNGYIYKVLHEQTKEIIVTREQESSPWIVFRWSVAPGEIYGRGPAMFALPDIKSINKTKELILMRASIDAAGMYTAEEDLNLNNVQMGPMAIITVPKNPGGMGSASLTPLTVPGGFDVSQMVINDLRTSINETMFADPLGPIDLPVKTATEVAYRQQELAKRIGSAFGRLQYEMLSPLINRVLFVLNEWELLPIPAGDRVMLDGRIVNVKHESPLAAAQDQESVMAIQQFIQFLGSVFGPQTALSLIQPDKVVQHLAKYLNVPADIQLTQEQYEAIKQKIVQMGQMAEQNIQSQAG